MQNDFINFLILQFKTSFFLNTNLNTKTEDSLYSNSHKFIHTVVCHCDVYSTSYMMICCMCGDDSEEWVNLVFLGS